MTVAAVQHICCRCLVSTERGELRVCERRACQKAYHLQCIAGVALELGSNKRQVVCISCMRQEHRDQIADEVYARRPAHRPCACLRTAIAFPVVPCRALHLHAWAKCT